MGAMRLSRPIRRARLWRPAAIEPMRRCVATITTRCQRRPEREGCAKDIGRGEPLHLGKKTGTGAPTVTAINHTIGPEDAGRTLEAMLRRLLPGHSWEQVRKVVAARRVRLGRPPAVDLCMDSARRVHAGEMVQINERSAPPVARPGGLVVRYLDSQVVVVEKPSGLNTVRHPSERQWHSSRRELVPCLNEVISRQIANTGSRISGIDPRARLRIVHRIDKETSGLVVFARTVDAERALGAQFRDHTVKRRYLAIVTGHPNSGTIKSWLLRDRGTVGVAVAPPMA